MKIIISPAKKMNRDTDSLPWRDLPVFLPQAERLCQRLEVEPATVYRRRNKALKKLGERL